jgi:hypothetical protein
MSERSETQGREIAWRDMPRASISELSDQSSVDEDTGAVRSVQSAELSLPARTLGEMWSPVYLERLARTYWRFLTRITLGLVRVRYTERERFLVLVARPLKLISFLAPEYELEPDHGVVRWRIERGLLVARSGHGVGGHLQIDVRRLHEQEPTSPAVARVRVEVEVANFHPAIASGIGRWVYNQTQSRIHVIVTYGFLRSLARMNLARSRVGRFESGSDASSSSLDADPNVPR